MNNRFFEHPILNSPYEYPTRHWELDASGQPTQEIIETRRRAEFITPIPKPRKRKGEAAQQQMVFDEGKGLSTQKQQYDPTSIINELRSHVDNWRGIQNANHWQVTPETARLLQHWRYHSFSGIRPFFCQIEAVETAFWLTEVAPHDKAGKGFLEHLANASNDANPDLVRLALKLATGACKTTVMAMLIAWQTINAVHRPHRKGRGKAKTLDPLAIPVELQTALEALYGHYDKTFNLWQQSGIKAPPCFIVVCNNTSTSKLVYDYISGFHRENEDGSTTLENGRLALFRNFDEHGNPLARPRTLLIDSAQLESGDMLDDNFRSMATDEIDRFRREIIERTGDRQQADNLTNKELLREVMNTVGKEGR